MSADDWRSLAPRFPAYEINSSGQVRSWKTYNKATPPPYNLTASLAPNGYYYIKLLDADGKACNPTLHSLLAHAFIGLRPEGLVIRHLDGDPTNNVLSNLRYGTHSENNDDSVAHGTHWEARLTHCKRGHAFTPENTRHETRGNGRAARRCLACQREYDCQRHVSQNRGAA